MGQDITSKSIWNSAGISGAVLGIVSAGLMALSQAISGTASASILTAVVSFIIWAVKFVSCIWTMRFFMKKLCRDFNGVTGKETFRFGVITALFSALIYSAIYLAEILFIYPEFFSTQLDSIRQMYSSMLDSNSMRAMENMMDNYSTISFFSTLIYCFLYGTVLSAILSKAIPSNDPFANYNDSGNDGNPDRQ